MDALLGADELGAIASGARRLKALQKLYSAAVPPELARASRVKTCKGHTLVILADNAAVAAKLRQLAASMLAAIRDSAPELAAIRIETHVTGGLHERRPPPQKKSLGPDAVQSFDALSERVRAGPLRSAIRKLVRRHTARKAGVKR